MFGILWKLLPHDYKWSVAIKKVSYTVAKVGIGYLVGTSVGKSISPDKLHAVEEVTTAAIAGGLTYLHDWAQMKWPNNKWL